jgi:hypothetical protein
VIVQGLLLVGSSQWERTRFVAVVQFSFGAMPIAFDRKNAMIPTARWPELSWRSYRQGSDQWVTVGGVAVDCYVCAMRIRVNPH